MTDHLNQNYWEKRYQSQDIKWDIGAISTPIKNWLDLENRKDLKILIPGAGSGYEVAYAYSLDFQNVYYLDFATNIATDFSNRNPDFPKDQILNADFYSLNKNGFFDIIIEQTFFCSQDPISRDKYINKSADLLRNNGKLIGLLFNTLFEKEGPPFGGNLEDYVQLFENRFNILCFEECNISIPPRQGNEIWMELQKKK